MNHRHPILHPLDPYNGISAAVLNPIGVKLRLHKARIGLVEYELQPTSRAKSKEFKTMIVVAEGEPGFIQPLADAIGDFGKTPETSFALAVFQRHAPDCHMTRAPLAVLLDHRIGLPQQVINRDMRIANGQAVVIADAFDISIGDVSDL